MTNTIYLDTNQFVRVFERECETLFPRFANALEQNDWTFVVSEGNVLEVFHGIAKGANLDTVLKGLDLVESLRPLWLCISGLDVAELRHAWPEFLATVLKTRDVSVMIDHEGWIRCLCTASIRRLRFGSANNVRLFLFATLAHGVGLKLSLRYP